jgi:hypothetical protein
MLPCFSLLENKFSGKNVEHRQAWVADKRLVLTSSYH